MIGNTSQVYVEKAVPSGLDSVWKKRSLIRLNFHSLCNHRLFFCFIRLC